MHCARRYSNRFLFGHGFDSRQLHQNKSTRRTPAGVFALVLRELLRSQTGRQYRSTSPMADAERGCRAFVILGGITLIIPVVCPVFECPANSRLPLIQGRHKKYGVRASWFQQMLARPLRHNFHAGQNVHVKHSRYWRGQIEFILNCSRLVTAVSMASIKTSSFFIAFS